MKDPVQILQYGRQLLDPILKGHGFRWVPGKSGSSSGGHFASGEYVRDDRRLELHYRHGLGLVTYHVGCSSVQHSEFTRAQPASSGGHKYPGYSDEPQDAIRDLAYDLKQFSGVFLCGTEEEFTTVVGLAESNQQHARNRRLP